MGFINIRIDDELKIRSYAALKKLGITPSELLRQTLEYVVKSGKLPFKSELINDEESDLLETVRERLRNSQRGIKVTLDDL